MPWARAYDLALKHKNVLIFTLCCSPEREKLFKFGGLISIYDSVLIAKKSKNISIKKLSDLKGYRIGVERNDVYDQRLSKVQGAIIEREPRHELNIKKLQMDRIDLWATDVMTAGWFIKRKNLNHEEYIAISKLFDTKASLRSAKQHLMKLS